MTHSRRTLLLAPVALAVALVVALPASATSPLAAKRAEAQQVYNEVQALDENLGRADELLNLANLKLRNVEYEQSVNRHELVVARVNLAKSQQMIAERLVSLYTTPQPSSLDMILGATSLSDLLSRMDDADHVSSLDGQVIAQVESFKSTVERAAHALVRERAEASQLLGQRHEEQRSISDQLSERQQVLSSIKGQIATLEAQAAAQAAAEQAQLEQEAQQQIQAQQTAEQAASQAQAVGATAATPGGGSVLPTSPYGSRAVSIAMSYLGVPYVWGGSTPSGFDCSGLVMYSFAQLGVSLPHSSYAMYDYGIPVPENELEPGDLVFFDGLGHVGLYIGGGEYVNAPYTGSVVSVASLDTGWSAANYVGARRII